MRYVHLLFPLRSSAVALREHMYVCRKGTITAKRYAFLWVFIVPFLQTVRVLRTSASALCESVAGYVCM
jgi:hypothetical protein